MMGVSPTLAETMTLHWTGARQVFAEMKSIGSKVSESGSCHLGDLGELEIFSHF